MISDEAAEPRALTTAERITLMRVILKRSACGWGPQPAPMMAEEATQRLHGAVLTPSEIRFYVVRVALWDT